MNAMSARPMNEQFAEPGSPKSNTQEKMPGSHSFENISLYESIDIVAVSISMYLAIRANIAIFQQAASYGASNMCLSRSSSNHAHRNLH